MTTEVGWAALGIVPVLDRQFDSRLSRALGPSLDRNGRLAGGRFGSAFGRSFSTFAGVGVGALAVKLVKDSVTLEASYSKTFRQIGVAADVPAKRLERLDTLAQQLGQDTIFSTQDAADAMLALVKNGITPATIEAGALQQALTLGAAGDLPLAEAADIMSNALNAFGLKGKDAIQVSSALAGAANASSASVGDLAQALQQSSAGAHDAGLSVQETAGALAAFANAGIRGSDAGTSLKTFLSRLVPQTKKARDEMQRLGLDFTDATGTFLPLADIAQQLKKKLGDLSQEDRSLALQTVFGSDARRAATILTNQGAEGVKKYTKATSDQTQAEKLAKAALEGSSGSLEQLKGSIENAELAFGKGLEPTTERVTQGLTEMLQAGDFEKWGREIGAGLQNIGEEYGPLGGELKDLGQELLPAIGTTLGVVRDALETAAPLAADLVGAFNDAPEWVQKGTVFAGLAALVGKKSGLLGNITGGGKAGGLASRPVPVFVTNPGFGGGVDIPGVPTKTPGGGKGGFKIPPILAEGGSLLAGLGFGAALGGTVNDHPWAGNPDNHFAGASSDEIKDLIAKGEAENGQRQLDVLGSLLSDPLGKKVKIDTVVDILGLVETDAKLEQLRRKAERPITIPIVAKIDDALNDFFSDAFGGDDHAASEAHPKGRQNGNRTPVGRTGAGVTVHGDLVVNAQDVRAAQRDVQRIAQQAGLGGRPPS